MPSTASASPATSPSASRKPPPTSRDSRPARASSCPTARPLRRGDRLVQADYAATLRAIAAEGPSLLYGGALGGASPSTWRSAGGLITLDDLVGYRTVERTPVRGTYRGFEIVGCPPPTGGGIHLIQILNLLEGFDVAGLGFGTVDGIHLLAEALKIAFADRTAATGDPGVRGRAGRAPDRQGVRGGAASRHRHGQGRDVRPPVADRAAPRTPRTSPWPTVTATWSPPRRRSTACSARARWCPTPACC